MVIEYSLPHKDIASTVKLHLTTTPKLRSPRYSTNATSHQGQKQGFSYLLWSGFTTSHLFALEQVWVQMNRERLTAIKLLYGKG